MAEKAAEKEVNDGPARKRAKGSTRKDATAPCMDKPSKQKARASTDEKPAASKRTRKDKDPDHTKKSFARRFMPTSPLLKARWLAIRDAFQQEIKPWIPFFGKHEVIGQGYM